MKISYECAQKCVPVEFYNFLAWVVCETGNDVDTDGRIVLEKKQHENLLNLAQDMCAATTNVKTPKQVGMAHQIMKTSRSKDMVTILNRFGHCVSYTEAQRYTATFAGETEDQVDIQGFFVPQNIAKGLFRKFAIDNLDFEESTRDGKTTHGRTHIIFQYRDGTMTLRSSHNPRQTKRSTTLIRSTSLEPRQLCEPHRSSAESVGIRHQISTEPR